MDLCKFLCDNFEGVFVSDSDHMLISLPNKIRNNLESVTIGANNEVIFTGKGDKLPLVIRYSIGQQFCRAISDWSIRCSSTNR